MINEDKIVIKHIFHHVTSNLFPVILGLIGAGIIILSTSRFNAGVNPDSVDYISEARNIADGNGVTYWDGSPTIRTPPLFPIVLAAIDRVINIDPLLSARFVNALLFGIIVYLSGVIFKRHLQTSLAFIILGTVFVLFSFELVHVSLMVRSDPLFICFVLLYLIFSETYIEKRNATSLVLLSLFVVLASLTRYAGIALIPSGIIYTLFSNRDKPATKIRHFFLFISISILPITAWLIRNLILSGSLFGYNQFTFSGPVTFYEGVANTYQVVTKIIDLVINWYLPNRITNRYLLMILCLTTGFIAGLGYQKSQKKLSGLFQIYPILLFLVVYTGFLIYSVGPGNLLESRYLSPIFVSITLLLLIFAEKFLKPHLARLTPKHTNLSLMAIVAVLLIFPTVKTMRDVKDQLAKGSGYTSEIWKTSETIQYLIQHPELESDCPIYTNHRDGIYILTGLKTESSPNNELRGGVREISLLRGLWPQESKACLVWFDPNTPIKYKFSPEELISIVSVEKVIQFRDGVIYTISRK